MQQAWGFDIMSTVSKKASRHRLLSPTQVAYLLELQPRTVARWCREGKIPAHKYGRVWRIRLEDYRRFASGSMEPIED
jgi:excisionase family DNA binding protein